MKRDMSAEELQAFQKDTRKWVTDYAIRGKEIHMWSQSQRNQEQKRRAIAMLLIEASYFGSMDD